jgi:hypothetical protein
MKIVKGKKRKPEENKENPGISTNTKYEVIKG